ncbi:hypothetical protein ACFFWD_42100 [Bradyrhizobium erythrophlei]|uniref:hypothetical protein n=1 Tax=Bradyrhizobium erythrophlei TaxID=1437360 RepID=UPI0035E5D51F
MAQQPRRGHARRRATSATANAPLAILRAQRKKDRIEFATKDNAAAVIERLARDWSYTLRVRTRWAGDSDLRDYFAGRAVDDLATLGIAREHLTQLAAVEHIEVQLGNEPMEQDDASTAIAAAAELPWEYLLSAATRSVGRLQPLLVTRCIPNGSTAKNGGAKKIMFFESAPGRIAQLYEFDDEEARIAAAVNVRGSTKLEFVRSEPLSELKQKLGGSCDAIHVTGIDTHQAAWLIPGYYDTFKDKLTVIDESDRLHDGMILRGDHQGELPVRYDELAGILLGPAKHPQIVTLNLYYSGARTARELVRRGAYAALGFLDEIDDEFAERFFQAFYWAWCRDRRSIPKAFLEAWTKMDGDRMHGTGIVIWLGRSMVGEPAGGVSTTRRRAGVRR